MESSSGARRRRSALGITGGTATDLYLGVACISLSLLSATLPRPIISLNLFLLFLGVVLIAIGY